MAEGRSNQAIAERLFVTLRAVEKHVTSIFTKLGLPATTDDHRRVLAVLTYLRQLTATGAEVRLAAPADACTAALCSRRSGGSLRTRQRPSKGTEMSPLKRSTNIAARMGRWSASHRKTAIFGWLAFVVAVVRDRHRGRR